MHGHHIYRPRVNENGPHIYRSQIPENMGQVKFSIWQYLYSYSFSPKEKTC